jgi:hypothetical protein
MDLVRTVIGVESTPEDAKITPTFVAVLSAATEGIWPSSAIHLNASWPL